MWHRLGIEAHEVDRENFLTECEASRELRLLGGPLSVGLLKSYGVLEPAFLPNGMEGVTRASVQREIDWRASAAPWRRLVRRLGHWVSRM